MGLDQLVLAACKKTRLGAGSSLLQGACGADENRTHDLFHAMEAL